MQKQKAKRIQWMEKAGFATNITGKQMYQGTLGRPSDSREPRARPLNCVTAIMVCQYLILTLRPLLHLSWDDDDDARRNNCLWHMG
jgi:hypothetical protein